MGTYAKLQKGSLKKNSYGQKKFWKILGLST